MCDKNESRLRRWLCLAPALALTGAGVVSGSVATFLTGLSLLVLTAELTGRRRTNPENEEKDHRMGLIKKTIIVKNDTIKIDIYDDLDDHLCNKVVAGQGITVRKTKRRVPTLVVESTQGKHHYAIGTEEAPMTLVPDSSGTVVVDSSKAPVVVILPDPAARNGIKRITVVAYRLAYPITVTSVTGEVFDADNVEFGVEGTSYTFAAIKAPDQGVDLEQAVPPYNPPEGQVSSSPADQMLENLVESLTGDKGDVPDDVHHLGAGWQWYPIARYVPGWGYY